MIEKICNNLTNKIRNKMPEINEERAEVINYGLQLLIGEIPKTFILLLVAYLCGVLELSILALLFILPYKTFSGGVHLKTHIGCIIGTSLFYVGNALLSKYIVLGNVAKYILIAFVWIFSIAMIKLYAPADTEEVPILRKKERSLKKNLSYVTMTITLIISLFVTNVVISKLLIFGVLIQTISITRFVYNITKSKYGYEEYIKSQKINVVT